MGGANYTSSHAQVPSPVASDSAALPGRVDASPAPQQQLPTRLHIALWNGDLAQIRACVHDPEALETRDRRGNRALHLALKFAHRNATAIAQCLVDAGARVRSRDTSGWKTIHHAIATDNEALVKLLVQREKEQAPALLARKVSAIGSQLAQLADFYCEIRVDVSTWLPGVSRWLPSDTIKIWKRGHDVRFDISLVGLEHGGWKRGRLSFLLLGSRSDDDNSSNKSGVGGRFLCLDHEARASMDLLAPGAPMRDDDLDTTVHFLMTTSIVTSRFDVSNVAFREKRRWLSHSGVVQGIGRWANALVYDVIGIDATLRIRKPQNKHHQAPTAVRAAAAAIKSASTAPAVEHNNDDADDDSTFAQFADAFTGETSATIEIDARDTHVVSIELRCGESVTWTFSTETYDIAFGVQFFADPTSGDDDDDDNDDDNNGDRRTATGSPNGRIDVIPLQRCASHEQTQRGSFSAPRAGTVVFTWDNSYSHFRRKTLHVALEPSMPQQQARTEGDMIGSVAGQLESHHGAHEELMTFEDWFGVRIDALPAYLRAMHPKRQIMVHAQPPSRELRKSFSATVFMSDKFPLTVHEFLPVIELLSKTTNAFENVKAFFEAQSIDGFPVQFCVPLLPSISATFRFDAMELREPDAILFVVPTHYSRRDEDVLSPRKQQEVLQCVAAV